MACGAMHGNMSMIHIYRTFYKVSVCQSKYSLTIKNLSKIVQYNGYVCRHNNMYVCAPICKLIQIWVHSLSATMKVKICLIVC